MIPSLSIPKNIWLTALLAFTILAGGQFIIHQVPLIKRDIAATGLLADMVITFPIGYYLLIIRPLKLRKWNIMLVITVCCAVAYFTLPAHQRYYVIQLRKLSILIELAGLVYVFSKIKKIKNKYNQLQTAFPDFAYNLHRSLAVVLGNGTAVKLLASELTILRFGLFCWIKPQKIPSTATRFTVYKNSGYTGLYGVMLFVSMFEIIAMHLILMQYSAIAALVVSVLSFYGIIFIVSDLSATVKSPVLMLKDKLLLRTGLRWQVLVNINNIASVEKIKDSYQADTDCFKGGILKSSINILLTFKHPISVNRLYKKPVTVNKIVMSMDEADKFILQLTTNP